MSRIELAIPNARGGEWRVGQTIFNFLQWLDTTNKIPARGGRMADPFYLDDAQFHQLWEQFVAEMEQS